MNKFEQVHVDVVGEGSWGWGSPCVWALGVGLGGGGSQVNKFLPSPCVVTWRPPVNRQTDGHD